MKDLHNGANQIDFLATHFKNTATAVCGTEVSQL